MKKILSLFLVFTLVFSLSACGSNSKEKDNETESQTETVQEVDLTTCVTGLRDRVVEVNTKPDWMDGVRFDEKYVKSVKSDDSKVDMTKAGEYQLTYNITGVESKDFIAKDVKVIKKVTVKEKMTEEEKASEEQKTAEAQKQDVKPVIEEKESGNSDKNSSSSKPNNNSSSSSDNSSPSKPNKPAPSEPAKPSKPAHQHDWKTEYKTVHHEAQYRNEPVYKDEIVYEDRPVYKWQAYWTCNECNQRFENEKDVARHALMICGGGWTAHKEQVQTGTEQVQVGTNRVQVGTNPVLVKDAWDEQVPNGQSCSCGARK
jgi:hypothetical protein